LGKIFSFHFGNISSSQGATGQAKPLLAGGRVESNASAVGFSIAGANAKTYAVQIRPIAAQTSAGKSFTSNSCSRCVCCGETSGSHPWDDAARHCFS